MKPKIKSLKVRQPLIEVVEEDAEEVGQNDEEVAYNPDNPKEDL